MIASKNDLISSSTHSTSNARRRNKLERTTSPQSVTCFFPSPKLSTKADCSDRSRRTLSTRTTSTRTISSAAASTVRFHTSVAVRFTRSHHDYTPRQIKDCFYQAYELKKIKKKCFEDLRRHLFWGDQDEMEEFENETYCYRGLESFGKLGNTEKRRNRAEAANAVFDAEDDGCDEATIAKEYASVARRCQTWANVLGLRDQRDALAIYGQEE